MLTFAEIDALQTMAIEGDNGALAVLLDALDESGRSRDELRRNHATILLRRAGLALGNIDLLTDELNPMQDRTVRMDSWFSKVLPPNVEWRLLLTAAKIVPKVMGWSNARVRKMTGLISFPRSGSIHVIYNDPRVMVRTRCDFNQRRLLGMYTWVQTFGEVGGSTLPYERVDFIRRGVIWSLVDYDLGLGNGRIIEAPLVSMPSGSGSKL